METITVKIKAPPKGWKHEPRYPKKQEDAMYYDTGRWMHGCRGADEHVDNVRGGIYAFRITQK